jgi:hypothetical protein
MQARLGSDGFKAASSPIREALILQEEILRHIPAIALISRPQSQGDPEILSTQGPLEFACSFYGIENPFSISVQRACVNEPFVTNFEDLTFLTTNVATSLMSCTPELAQPLRGVFAQSVLLIMRLLGRMDQRLDTPFDVDWNPSEWLSVVLESVEHPVRKISWDRFCVRFHSGFTGFNFHNGRSCHFPSGGPPSLTVDPTHVVD